MLKGNGADVAQHCVPPVTARRMSITLRRCLSHLPAIALLHSSFRINRETYKLSLACSILPHLCVIATAFWAKAADSRLASSRPDVATCCCTLLMHQDHMLLFYIVVDLLGARTRTWRAAIGSEIQFHAPLVAKQSKPQAASSNTCWPLSTQLRHFIFVSA